MRKRFPNRGGFTLLEILLSIAIIGLLAGVLIGGSAQLLRDKPATVDEVFWKSVQEARKAALRHEREVRLKFAIDDKEKTKSFLVVDGDEIKRFPVPPAMAGNDLAVDFLTAQKGANAMLVGGTLIEGNPVPYVTFFPDGTCTAFRVQIVRGGATHPLSIDQWTCAPVLTPPDPYAPRI